MIINKQGEYKSNAKERPCLKCNKPAGRYCLGGTCGGEYKWGFFCLGCEPFGKDKS
ncbi:MAG TPA: hypothetical protein QF423_05800 [Candidatus Scalindua sp.]|jgi:hypothetical protein|nr:hypothetical protein [Candidatus Scalindua sp.]|tara:strand:- start:260 stop:427 length:168 start_codon:yes stop_codon:yes gene_type:complete